MVLPPFLAAFIFCEIVSFLLVLSQSCVSLAQSIKESIHSCGRLVVKIRRLDRIKPAAATFTEAERVANWTRGEEEEEDIGRLPLQTIQLFLHVLWAFRRMCIGLMKDTCYP